MRPLGSDFTHGTEPRMGRPFMMPDGAGGTYETSQLYAGAWDHTRFRGIRSTLQRLNETAKPDSIINAATDLRRFFLDHRNRPSQRELDEIVNQLDRLDRPILWYAYTLGLKERALNLFNGGIKNMYQRELESLLAPPLRSIVEEVAASRDKTLAQGLKKELEVMRAWAMDNPHVFGAGHQTELTELIRKLKFDVKDVFVTNAVLAEIGDALAGLRDGNPFFKNIANFFTRKVIV